MTRPEIAFVVQVLSQYMHSPKSSHMEAALRVVRYIKGTAGLGLFMPSNKDNEMYLESQRNKAQYQGALQKQNSGVWPLQLLK
uniref:Reverse transcriptase Ty1/copia-type domain-containing protein n=1 Tax=Solanum lycopersicum TaxID=4081 RepID=A0A3Q7EFU5_SOLLC